MLSGRVASESQLCVMSPNKWSDQNEYATYLNPNASAGGATLLSAIIHSFIH